ncbi:hypothetical protein HR060_02975 [Catenovulum sp. SM1970]|uniref:hypothetical protein n=1 Tax=Marinifaba aquimaris TaxID=2741323 RepID=UPI001572EB21|nr:hypothetical protein [Marinifaba aquimaris]NTS75819.1 hypothetical protein [Marinifaba aquimaris]
MKKIADLTEVEFRQLLDEYYAPTPKRSKLTPAQVQTIAQQLNEKINVPLVSESKEEKILVKVVLKVDNYLYNNLPNELYDLVRSLDKGIDDEEAKRLIKRLSELANDYIDIPYLPEVAEYFAIRFVIAIIINGARKHCDFAQASEKALSIPVPTSLPPHNQTDDAFFLSLA